MLDKVVILARGLGTRMQKNNGADISEEQKKMADIGLKAMIPLKNKRPFLDYILHNIAAAGLRQVCLVIGPEHEAVREYYSKLPSKKLKFDFAIQKDPRGTGDAVAAAEKFTGDDNFVVINSDNLYPAEAFVVLKKMDGPGLIVYDPAGIFVDGKIPPNRWGVIETDGNGYMRRIVEKPSDEEMDKLIKPLGVNMNCWRFDKNIYTSCRSIEPSARGELEITSAAQHAIDELGVKFAASFVKADVLDLSNRADISHIEKKLADEEIDL